MARVTKDSVRGIVGLKRLPKRFRMYVAGLWLYDVLKANGLHKKYKLWSETYWVVCKSLDTDRLTIQWRACK
jgi:hypothetical protein